MKTYNLFISAILLTSLSAGVASAQDSDSADKYHPYLSDNFNVSLGVFRPKKTFTIGLDSGSEASEELDTSDEQSTGALALRWRFTDNWSTGLEASYTYGWRVNQDTGHSNFPTFKWNFTWHL